MTPRTPQVGDTITTAEELDALPIGTILAAVESGAPAGIDLVVRWSGSWRTDGVSWPIDPSAYFPLTVLYLPGHPPRPEREVKAEALREATMGWQLGGWHADLPRTADRPALILGMAQRATEWFRAEADRIARGDS